MRGRRFLIFIALLVLLACAVFGACDGPYKNKEELPLKPWQDYIGEISSAIDRHYINISTKRQIAFELDLEAVEESSGDKYECSLALNLNVGQRTGQAGALRITRIRGEEKRYFSTFIIRTRCYIGVYGTRTQANMKEYRLSMRR